MTRLALTLAFLLPAPALAHYGMIIPSDNMVAQDEARDVALTLSFGHPFTGEGMTLVPPRVFRLHGPDGVTNLSPALSAATVMGEGGFTATLPIAAPGLHVLYMEPEPYWEPAEDVFIVHHTKTYITAFGVEDGWDEPLGLVTEIVPLSKPYGLWAGNLFQGRVLRDGAPVPHAEVEVEYLNEGTRVTAPSDVMVTQTIRADADGVFSYAAPGAGWWGFAALTEADFKLPQDGVEKAVELGAVIWVRFEAWP